MAKSMKAVVVDRPGPPEVLTIRERPVPAPEPGWVLIRVKAFGLNRAELFTRQGDSPSVTFPRVLGIEAVGLIADAPGGEFTEGQTVATVMGGMGRAFDGGYAEYTCVPAAQVRAIETGLDWAAFGALPEMIQTAWGCLHTTLGIQAGDKLLVRGGTTSVGLAAIALANRHGLVTLATTRREARVAALRGAGADHVLVDDGALAPAIRALFPGGVDHVIELVGAATLRDSLAATRAGGTVCMAGIMGGWEFEAFSPLDAMPNGVRLTVYGGKPADFMNTPLQAIVRDIEAGRLSFKTDRVFAMADIVAAHRHMEANQAFGKVVVVTE